MSIKTETENKSYLQFSWSKLIFLFCGAIAVYFIGTKLIGAKEGWILARQLNPLFIILAICFEILSYLGGSFMLRFIFQRIGYVIRFRDLFKMATIGYFAMHFFPIAGAGEVGLYMYLFRKKGISSGDMLFMFMIRGIFMYLALFILLFCSLFFVHSYPAITETKRIVVFALLVFAILFIFWVISRIRNKDKFYKSAENLFRFINWFGKIFAHRDLVSSENITRIINEIWTGFSLFKKDRKTAFRVILAGLIYWIGDAMCLYLIIAGFGYNLGFGPLFFTYSVTTIASLITFIPGGLGINESVSTLLLIGFGIPASPAVFSVLIYRLISFWLIMPIGFLSFLALKKSSARMSKLENS